MRDGKVDFDEYMPPPPLTDEERANELLNPAHPIERGETEQVQVPRTVDSHFFNTLAREAILGKNNWY